MNTAKDHTVYVRGVSRKVLHSLKRQAIGRRQSLNGFMLVKLDEMTAGEIAEHTKKRISEKIKAQTK